MPVQKAQTGMMAEHMAFWKSMTESIPDLCACGQASKDDSLLHIAAQAGSSSSLLPAGEDSFLSAAHGFHEDLVVEAGEFLHSGQQFSIPRSTLRNAAAGGFGTNEQPEAVWSKGAVAVGEDVDPFEFVPADCLDNPVGAVTGDFGFSDVDDELAFGVEPCARCIWRHGQNFGGGA